MSRRALLDRLILGVGPRLLDALMATLRYDVRGRDAYRGFQEKGSAVIFVLWHGRLLPLSHLHRHEGHATMISRSRDGDYIARVVERWGYTTARGSSSRGGRAALAGLIRELRRGRSVAITPDGPRGPRQKVKPSALQAARLTGCPLIPATAGADRAWWIRGWDLFLVPRPFAQVKVRYGSPMHVPAGADAGQLERLAEQLERELNRLTSDVDGGPTEQRDT